MAGCKSSCQQNCQGLASCTLQLLSPSGLPEAGHANTTCQPSRLQSTMRRHSVALTIALAQIGRPGDDPANECELPADVTRSSSNTAQLRAAQAGWTA